MFTLLLLQGEKTELKYVVLQLTENNESNNNNDTIHDDDHDHHHHDDDDDRHQVDVEMEGCMLHSLFD